MSRKTSPSSSQHEVLAAAAEPLDAPALDGVAHRLGRQRQAPARVGDLQALERRAPRRRGASWRRIVSTSGSSGTLSYEARTPGQRAARRGRSASAGRWRRRRPAGRRGGGRPWPAKTASSGACSRVWSVCGAVGSTPWSAVRTSRSSGAQQRRATRRPRRRSRCSARVEALDVLAVAVDLVGLDEVGEDQAGVEVAQQRGRRGERRARSSAPGCVLVDARRRRTGRGPCRRAWTGTPASLQLVEVGAPGRRRPRSRGGPSVRAERARLARRTAARSRARRRARRSSTARAAAHAAYSVGLGEHVVVRGELQHRVGRRVEDQLAGRAGGARRSRSMHRDAAARAVAAEAQPGRRLERARRRRAGSRPGRSAAAPAATTPMSSQWPSSSPCRARAGAGGRGRRARRPAARPRSATIEPSPSALERRQVAARRPPRRGARACSRPRRRSRRRRAAPRRRRRRARRRRRGGLTRRILAQPLVARGCALK